MKAMKRVLWVLPLVVGAGCDGVSFTVDGFRLNPSRVTLVLVNETEFPVRPSVYVSDLNDIIIEGLTESFLTGSENRQNFGDLEPGETVERSYDCDDFKAVMAQDAELLVGLGISPDDDSDIFLDDRDFECGDRVTIRYTGGILDFNARISATPG